MILSTYMYWACLLCPGSPADETHKPCQIVPVRKLIPGFPPDEQRHSANTPLAETPASDDTPHPRIGHCHEVVEDRSFTRVVEDALERNTGMI